MAKLPEKAKKVFSGVLFDVFQWDQEMFDGTTATFEMLKRQDTAVIIPVLPDGKILMCRDTQPHFGTVLTLPGGRIELGEDPLCAAQRELLEETGYTSTQWELYKTYMPTRKIEWEIHVYVAKQCEKVHEPELDAGEKIELEFFDFDEFLRLGQSDEYRGGDFRVEMLEALLDSNKADEMKTKFFH